MNQVTCRTPLLSARSCSHHCGCRGPVQRIIILPDIHSPLARNVPDTKPQD